MLAGHDSGRCKSTQCGGRFFVARLAGPESAAKPGMLPDLRHRGVPHRMSRGKDSLIATAFVDERRGQRVGRLIETRHHSGNDRSQQEGETYALHKELITTQTKAHQYAGKCGSDNAGTR